MVLTDGLRASMLESKLSFLKNGFCSKRYDAPITDVARKVVLAADRPKIDINKIAELYYQEGSRML